MKKVFGMVIALGLAVTTIGVHALSFGPDTIFLEADTAKECQDMGGTYTQWHEERYCTTTSSEILTISQQTKIGLVAQKIVNMIEDDSSLYTEVIDILEKYKTTFMNKKDTRRLAIALLLINDIESSVSVVPDKCSVWFDGCNTCNVSKDGDMDCSRMYCEENEKPYCIEYENDESTEIPETCSVRFDGCNTCQVGDNGELACTRIYCPEDLQEKPMCKVHEKIIKVADFTVECTGVGLMTCMLIQEDSEDDWTYFYDSIEGFEYIEGYEWTLLVEEEHLKPSEVPADASSIKWTLKEVIAIDKEVPETCSSWFDGCNTCIVGENGMMACTLMACMGEPMMPYCMDKDMENDPNVIQATEYNSKYRL